MNSGISDLLASLEPDPWRKETQFSADIRAASELLLDEAATDAQRVDVLERWFERHQPCLFGRIAARLGLIHFCILTPSDLSESDDFLRQKIQRERRAWTRKGFEGKASGFVVVALSRQIMDAVPGEAIQQLAQRLASLYLLQNIELDVIHYDEIFLEIPSNDRATWRWLCGVNYFCSQGDKRWWHDHRIPGGMAFSVNSVGHLVKSGKLLNALADLQGLFGLEDDQSGRPIGSLEEALELAMRTISKAALTSSGKATELMPLAEAPCHDLSCPIELPPSLAGMSYCEYRGYYHTDITLPQVYFSPDTERTSDAKEYRLDFTYLFDRRIGNPDFLTTGEGRLIRAIYPDIGPEEMSLPLASETSKIQRAVPEELPIQASVRLKEALGMR
ncbi:MAG TPA: hypothetical protein VF179_15430 [Thermoanaerobaculia bacterium]|nr:hypothetical protein [Thermoanaerobaculia bacterium]